MMAKKLHLPLEEQSAPQIGCKVKAHLRTVELLIESIVLKILNCLLHNFQISDGSGTMTQ